MQLKRAKLNYSLTIIGEDIEEDKKMALVANITNYIQDEDDLINIISNLDLKFVHNLFNIRTPV